MNRSENKAAWVARKAKQRKERYDAGYVRKEIWIKPEWWTAVQRLLDRLMKGDK